mmetsp:Transcript_1751/g.1474  ORF Transcript_1751/g.1474 Transcript_1751/m.1474 type:complete len:196 (-) Transcript_1751:233-820(-)
MWTKLSLLLLTYVTYCTSQDTNELQEIQNALSAAGVAAIPPSCKYAATDCPDVDQVCVRQICYRACDSDDDCIPSFECVSDVDYAGDLCKPRKAGKKTKTGGKGGGAKGGKKKKGKKASSATTQPPMAALLYDENISTSTKNTTTTSSILEMISLMVIGSLIVYACYYKKNYFCKSVNSEELQSISQGVSNYESV